MLENELFECIKDNSSSFEDNKKHKDVSYWNPEGATLYFYYYILEDKYVNTELKDDLTRFKSMLNAIGFKLEDELKNNALKIIASRISQ